LGKERKRGKRETKRNLCKKRCMRKICQTASENKKKKKRKTTEEEKRRRQEQNAAQDGQ